MYQIVALLLASAPQGLAIANPSTTPAPQLDPAFVGYINQSGTFANPRTCDYPQTVSTSGSYFQCCPATGACPFYTTCSSNTLLGGSATVPCDVNPGLACNTGIVKASTNAAGGASYLACWQNSLGTTPFTLVQDIGSASPSVTSSTTSSGAASVTSTGSSSSAASGGKSSSTTAPRTSSARAGPSTTSNTASSPSSSSAMAAGIHAGANTGLVGLIAYVVQLLI